MASERMTEADQAAIMLALLKELAKMKKSHEEVAKKNEEEIKNLQEENRRMKKLVDGVASLILTNQDGKSYATTVGLQAERELKNNFTVEMDGESHPNKTLNTTAPLAATGATPSPILLWTPRCRTSGRASMGIGTMGRPTLTNTWTRIQPT